MARLDLVVGLEGDQRKTLQVALEKMATEAKVAAGGTTAVELASIGYAGAKAGVGNDRLDAEGNIDQAGRQNDLMDFTRDTAVTATAFKMKPLDAADLLIGWRTSMSLNRAQTLDLADATSLLDSRWPLLPLISVRFWALTAHRQKAPEWRRASRGIFCGVA